MWQNFLKVNQKGSGCFTFSHSSFSPNCTLLCLYISSCKFNHPVVSSNICSVYFSPCQSKLRVNITTILLRRKRPLDGTLSAVYCCLFNKNLLSSCDKTVVSAKWWSCKNKGLPSYKWSPDFLCLLLGPLAAASSCFLVWMSKMKADL